MGIVLIAGLVIGMVIVGVVCALINKNDRGDE